ncbi:hypothetical protein BKA61DRAFT_682142 [Leptodontidium sp. MPI-SDFR-AT-0119]|nr:hypothetical protein BKA61DRAFT_682142 [Leptodontidium sp. MPI-SDFR-AT-0119]
MKEAYINKGLDVEIRDVPVPTAGPGALLIRVVVSGTNPKDWKVPKIIGGEPGNHGDDIAGYGGWRRSHGIRSRRQSRSLPPDVYSHGSYAEYSVAALPLPWDPVTVPTPLVVNGAATAVGSFAIKFAALAGLEGALKDLEASKISTTKYVLRLAETPGASN